MRYFETILAGVYTSLSKHRYMYVRVYVPLFVRLDRVVPFSIEPGECFKPQLPHDAVIPSAGFPSLHVLMVGSVEERKVPVNVFGTPSR